MRMHRLFLAWGIPVFFLMCQLLSVPAFGQRQQAPTNASKAWTPPRTAWGDPDLQGTWTSDDYINVPMQRPANLGMQLIMTDAEVAAREQQVEAAAQRALQEFAAPNAPVSVNPPGHWGERARRAPRQTSLIVDPEDGRTPELTPEGRARQAAATAARPPAGVSWESYSLYIRCITRGVMGSTLPVIYGNGLQIVQGPGIVTILYEMVHEARVIPLDGRPHVGANVRSYMGDARGRWEGNTLVVETTNFLEGKTGVGPNGGGVPLSTSLKLVERFTRADDTTISYEVTINDPNTYTKPWKIAFPITQEPGYDIFEYACHEGNYAMTNSLSAARAAEKASQ